MTIASPLITVSNASLGGNVVALLLRENELRGNEFLPFDGSLNPRPFIAGVPVSTRFQEAYTYSADVTKHAVESGALLSDHIILHPLKLDMSFDISNWEPDLNKQAFELLEIVFKSRIPLDLITEHKQINNMVMINLTIDNSVPMWGKLDCKVSFQQLNLVTLETIAFPKSAVAPKAGTGGPSTPKSAETAVDKGKQTPRASVLFKLSSS